jgi:hypothetical protein
MEIANQSSDGQAMSIEEAVRRIAAKQVSPKGFRPQVE